VRAVQLLDGEAAVRQHAHDEQGFGRVLEVGAVERVGLAPRGLDRVELGLPRLPLRDVAAGGVHGAVLESGGPSEPAVRAVLVPQSVLVRRGQRRVEDAREDA
jgi:hypothetical protein